MGDKKTNTSNCQIANFSKDRLEIPLRQATLPSLGRGLLGYCGTRSRCCTAICSSSGSGGRSSAPGTAGNQTIFRQFIAIIASYDAVHECGNNMTSIWKVIKISKEEESEQYHECYWHPHALLKDAG